MADNKPGPEGEPKRNAPKLPPRSGDWQSGLKQEGNRPARKQTTDGTVSDFLASGQAGSNSPGWDPVDSEKEWSPDQTPEGHRRDPLGDDNAVPPRPRRRHSFYTSHTRFSDLLIALLLALVAFATVATTYRGFGHSWDEALYLRPAERAAAWMLGVINSGDDSMMRPEAVNRHWGTALTGHDPLHPEVAPVPKLLPGAGLTYLQEPFNLDPMTAMRLPNAILFGLTVGLLFLLGTREYGRIGGFAAAIFYVLMPRVFGHAHLAASETPLAFFTVLTVWCFLIGNRFWPFALFTGIALGAAIATKVTALALPIPLMIWGQLYKRRDYASNVFAMAFIAPLVALALWPWLWHDTFARAVNYLGFYLNHQKTALFYLGRIWGFGSPDAPITYAPHLTILVLPVWMLFFLALGALQTLLSTVRRPVSVLFAVMALFWIGLTMLPNAPRYDGERLWFPAFAFLALIAGGGFSLIFGGVRRWRERRAGDHRETGYIAAITLLVLIAAGAVDIYLTHPNQLNYFNWITGRARGAYERGFETSYWGEAVNEEVLDYLNQTLEPGDKVKTLALNSLAFENLRQWGKLPAEVDFTPDEPPFDYVIMQVRQGFMTTPERRIWRRNKPIKTFEANGVPRILVFDATAAASVFPPPPAEDDDETTATLAAEPSTETGDLLTTSTLPSSPVGTTVTEGTLPIPGDLITTSGAAIAPVEDTITTAAAVRARDFSTTRSRQEERLPSPDQTTATEVLDLPTTSAPRPSGIAPPSAPEPPEPADASTPPSTPAPVQSEPQPEPTPAATVRETTRAIIIEDTVPAPPPATPAPPPQPAPVSTETQSTSPAPTVTSRDDTPTTTAPDIAPSQTLRMPESLDTETSAPGTYEDDLPSTTTLLVDPED